MSLSISEEKNSSFFYTISAYRKGVFKFLKIKIEVNKKAGNI